MVEELIKSFPEGKGTGKCIPCDDGHYVKLRHIVTRQQLAIYILYEYKGRKVFLPTTICSYCTIPEACIGAEYESILGTFLKMQAKNRFYFFTDKLYQHYCDEMKTLMEDLQDGGNSHVTKEMCLQMWVYYRTLFREEPYSTTAVVMANPSLCRKLNITYAGPLLI